MADWLNRIFAHSSMGYDVNPEYCDLARERLGLFGGAA